MGLRVLHEADAWDDELVLGACDWLDAVAPPEGATTFVDPSVEGWPHAPWWQVEPGLAPSMISAGVIAGVLLARDVKHPWLERTVEWLRGTRQPPTGPTPCTARSRSPSTSRAWPIGSPRRSRQPSRSTRTPTARSTARLASPAGPIPPHAHSSTRSIIERHLDHLENGQREDGGWTFNFPAWSSAQENDWRGCSRLTRSSRCATTGARLASSFAPARECTARQIRPRHRGLPSRARIRCLVRHASPDRADLTR